MQWKEAPIITFCESRVRVCGGPESQHRGPKPHLLICSGGSGLGSEALGQVTIGGILGALLEAGGGLGTAQVASPHHAKAFEEALGYSEASKLEGGTSRTGQAGGRRVITLLEAPIALVQCQKSRRPGCRLEARVGVHRTPGLSPPGCTLPTGQHS